MYGMWINQNGADGKITMEKVSGHYTTSVGTFAFTDQARIAGCTILNEGTYEFSGSPTNVFEDSVFAGVETNGTSSLSATNCTFNESLTDMVARFTLTSMNSQYGWTPPADYPLIVSNHLYDTDLATIILNKGEFSPFSEISYPPNPGVGYSLYSGYEYGLFGSLRNQYT